MLRYAQHDKFACSINLRYHVILNEVKNLKHTTTKMLRYAQHDKFTKHVWTNCDNITFKMAADLKSNIRNNSHIIISFYSPFNSFSKQKGTGVSKRMCFPVTGWVKQSM